MTLKAVLETIDDLPEAVQSLYTEKDGSYHLAVDGMVDKSKLDEFRSNNVKLMKQIDGLQKKFDGVDLDQYQELLQQQQKLEDDKLIDAGKIDELVEERTKRMREEFESQNKKLVSQNDSYASQLSTLVIDNSVRDIASKSGVLSTAVDDVLLRAHGVFSLEGGAAVPKDSSGNVVYGSDGESPMAVAEWMKGLVKSAPHLFESSDGAGSRHGKKPAPTDNSNLSPLQKLQQGFGQVA